MIRSKSLIVQMDYKDKYANSARITGRVGAGEKTATRKVADVGIAFGEGFCAGRLA